MNLSLKKWRPHSGKKRLLPAAEVFLIYLIALSLFGSPKTVMAAFEDITIGGRAAAMAGAYSALAEDGYTIYYNPAGLAPIPRGIASVQYSKLHLGLDDNSDLSNSYVALAQPLKFNTRDFGTVGAGWMQFALAGYYQENTIFVSWARDIVMNKLSAGLSAKILSIKYGEDEYTSNALDNEGKTTGIADPLFSNGYSVGATDFDIGLRWPFARNYTVSLVAQNITGANVSLGGKDPGATLEKRYRLGFAHTGKLYALSTDIVAIMPSDITAKNQETKTRALFGAEKSFAFGGALRGGIGIGSDGWANVSGGIGYATDGLSFDYGVIMPLAGIKDTYGSHRVSVNLKFGPVMRHPESDSELKVRLAEEITARREIEQKYKVSEMELARAKEEIKQLKAQIEELLKRPAAPIPSPKEIPAARPKPGVSPAQPPERVTPAIAPPAATAAPSAPLPTDIDQIKAMYAREFNQYQKDSAKLDLKKRLVIIDNIVSRYQGKIKITEALDEQMILKNELAAQTKFYNDALSYYKRLVRQGISTEERKDILKRMIAKYEPLGVDVTAARDELSQIK